MSSTNSQAHSDRNGTSNSTTRERWVLFPSSKTEMFVAAFRDEETAAGSNYYYRTGWSQNSTALSEIKRFRANDLEQVSLFVASDVADEDFKNLVRTLRIEASRKHFKFISVLLPGTLKELLPIFDVVLDVSKKFSLSAFELVTRH